MLGVALVVGGYLVGHDMHKAAMESYYTFTNTGRKPESLGCWTERRSGWRRDRP